MAFSTSRVGARRHRVLRRINARRKRPRACAARSKKRAASPRSIPRSTRRPQRYGERPPLRRESEQAWLVLDTLARSDLTIGTAERVKSSANAKARGELRARLAPRTTAHARQSQRPSASCATEGLTDSAPRAIPAARKSTVPPGRASHQVATACAPLVGSIGILDH